MKHIALLLLIGAVACDVPPTAPVVDASAPTNLSFKLDPSGDPNAPLGVLLTWDAPSNGRAVSYNIFGQTNAQGWLLRATTSSLSFHDDGVPQTQYYVVALDDRSADMGRSATITIDLTDRLPFPQHLTSISLNGAVQLRWDDNAYEANRSAFDHYRVYSSTYSATTGKCVDPWYFEGSTVSDAFLVGNLPNGVSRCFAVSAVSVDGHESDWSDAHLDTPRFEARSALVYAAETRTDSAAFVFNDQSATKLGVVGLATRADADFIVNRHTDGTIWLTPARAGSAVTLYSSSTVSDLTAIDVAPVAGYQTSAIQAIPGMGYVFRVTETDGVHFAAVRVQYVAKDVAVFDWSYQIDIGNPELQASRHLVIP